MTAIDLEHARRRIEIELPRQVRWLIRDTPLDFDFSRSQRPLQPPSEAEIYGAVEKEWAALFLFGKQDYAEGGGAAPLLGVDIDSGEVRGLDVERASSCLFLLNSDIDSFIKTFHLFDQALRLGAYPVGSIASVAPQIDPRAFGHSEWSVLVEYLLEDET